ncbi:MAG: succinate dehydrogenase, cytochrome b556 subunit [Gammaproteobacteria bacterium]
MRQPVQPQFLDLTKIRLPLPGVVSILHRISGFLLVLAIPVSLYLLDLSLRNREGFSHAIAISHSLLFKLTASMILWSICHHLLAGLRFLLLDLEIGVGREQANQSSKIVLISSAMLTLLLLGVIW